MPREENAPQVYETMKLFRDRCLLDTRSLLWNEPGESTADQGTFHRPT